MLANICTMPINVPTIPNAGVQSPMARIVPTLVEMHQEIVAVPFEIVADEFEIVAVGDVTNALGQERFVGLDLFQADQSPACGRFRRCGQVRQPDRAPTAGLS